MPEKEESEIAEIPCWLCGRIVEIKPTKKGRPYFNCGCGLQAFIRYPEGEELLLKQVKEYQAKGET